MKTATEIYKNDAGNAMITLIGVNDQLNFTDINRISKLFEYSREMNFFKKCIENYTKEKNDVEWYKKAGDKIDANLAEAISLYEYWKRQFDAEYSDVEDNMENALWELDQLAKIATKAASDLRSSLNDKEHK